MIKTLPNIIEPVGFKPAMLLYLGSKILEIKYSRLGTCTGRLTVWYLLKASGEGWEGGACRTRETHVHVLVAVPSREVV